MTFASGVQHFILTRFNLLLWSQDKEGIRVRTKKWLEHRFSIFEKYCLPSVKNQTCQDFDWIVLFDSMTPDIYKVRISEYQKLCPQFIPIFVEPEDGRYFAKIFKNEIAKRQNAQRVLSTYLDNDDALNVKFVEDLQRRALSVDDGTFIYYDDGYQFYTESRLMMRIHYPKNHFVSVIEKDFNVEGVFGYGSHYYIDRIEGVRIEHVKNLPMWCEVIHEKNVINDAYFIFRTKMVREGDLIRNDFAIDESLRYGMKVYIYLLDELNL